MIRQIGSITGNTMAKHFTSIISSGFGKFASKEFPSAVQKFINTGYVKLMGLDMSEFKEPSASLSSGKALGISKALVKSLLSVG